MSYTLELPWPPKELSPNARTHWARKAKAVKSYREACFWLCKAHGCDETLKGYEGGLHLSITFLPPSRAKYDADGILSRMKAGIDGVADALGVNDRVFNPITVLRGEPIKGGKIIMEIKSHVVV